MLTLLPFPNIDPVLVEIPLGPYSLPIRWYALAYIAGIWLGYMMARAAIRRPALWNEAGPPLTREQLEEFLTWLILGIILGGRLGYVLFYGKGAYWENPAEILRVWDGGMSFHGGFIGVILAGLGFVWKHGVPIPGLADLIGLCTPPGLLLGRLANFINGELWGRPTDLPWGVVFPGAAAQTCPGIEPGFCARHPSQLYEAGLEGIVLDLLLVWLAFGRGWLKWPGAICGTFIAGYGVARFVVEHFRQADAQFITPDNPLGHVFQIGAFGITRGQELSLPMIAAGLLILALSLRRR